MCVWAPAGSEATLPETAAEAILARRPDHWRVQRRDISHESYIFLLFVMEKCLCVLPMVCAGAMHSMVVAPPHGLISVSLPADTQVLFSFGWDQHRQLGLGLGDGDDSPRQLRWCVPAPTTATAYLLFVSHILIRNLSNGLRGQGGRAAGRFRRQILPGMDCVVVCAWHSELTSRVACLDRTAIGFRPFWEGTRGAKGGSRYRTAHRNAERRQTVQEKATGNSGSSSSSSSSSGCSDRARTCRCRRRRRSS